MDSIHVTIQLLKEKVSYLKEQYTQQQARIVQLEKENEKLIHQAAQQQPNYSSHIQPQPLTNLLTNLPLNDSTHTATLRKQLEQHIRYLDECIAFIQEL
jgi:phage regulator Rha-like protein